MGVSTGLDRLHSEGFSRLRGFNLGVLCNQASLSRTFEHIIDLLLPLHQSGTLNIQAVFGPQHGLFGHTQDNMIEWEGHLDPRTGLHIYSLYGNHREPTDSMLNGIDLLLVDLPDVGARYYTFIWTLSLCMKACQRLGIPVLVLDRPNPIGGLQVEGTVLNPAYASFVGLHPLPSRHGLTIAEVAQYIQSKFYPDCELSIVPVEGWDRTKYLDELDATWSMPSPNMPTVDTAVVYPGGCLLEATNLSEGRGTTRPFEIFGAPYVDGWQYATSLNALNLPGAYFRPIQFQPTFNKFAGELCEGCFLHVTDRRAFEPVLTYVAILQIAHRLYEGQFAWKQPPYEYEYEKLPFDILAGNQWLRIAIERQSPLEQIRESFAEECSSFESTRREFILYPLKG